MARLDKITIDKELLTSGGWFEFEPVPGEVFELKISSSLVSDEFARFWAAASERIDREREKRALDKNPMTDAEIEELKEGALKEAHARFCVSGIRGLNGKNNKPIHYSWKAIVDIFNRNVAVFNRTAEIALHVSNFTEFAREKTEKNSPASSSGNSARAKTKSGSGNLRKKASRSTRSRSARK